MFFVFVFDIFVLNGLSTSGLFCGVSYVVKTFLSSSSCVCVCVCVCMYAYVGVGVFDISVLNYLTMSGLFCGFSYVVMTFLEKLAVFDACRLKQLCWVGGECDFTEILL